MTAYVYEVGSLDLLVIGGSVAVVGAVAVAATAILARRAARISRRTRFAQARKHRRD